MLAFYPDDRTAGLHSADVLHSAGLEVFADLGVLVWGISPQDLDRHEEFARQHSLGFPLLGVTYSDVDTIAEQVRKL